MMQTRLNPIILKTEISIDSNIFSEADLLLFVLLSSVFSSLAISMTLATDLSSEMTDTSSVPMFSENILLQMFWKF